MADTITSSANLAIGLEFTEETQDGKRETKTATITIPNYKSSVTEQQIKQAFANQNTLAYSYYPESGAPITIQSDNVVTASTTDQTINNIDIGWDG